MEKLPSGLVTIVNLPGTGSLLHRSWHLYAKHFAQFCRFAVLFLIGFLVNLGLTGGVEYLGRNTSGFLYALSQIGITTVGVLTAFYATFIFVGFVVFLNELRHGKLLSVSQSLEKGREHVTSVFWVAIIATFLLYGSLFTGVLFVIFSFWYYFALYLSIVDGERGISALAKSRYLTHGMFWKIAGRYVAILTLLFALYSLAYLTLGIPLIGWAVFLILLFGISFFTLPFFLIYDFIRFIDIVAVQRNVEFTQFKGERVVIASWALFGALFFSLIWGLNLLTEETQGRFIQSMAMRSARVILPYAKTVETNVQKLQELMGIVPSTDFKTDDAINNFKGILETTPQPLDDGPPQN